MTKVVARSLAVIGGGPAGLMAAEVARAAGIDVDVFDRKGSVGRKLLVAGKGGLNLTHSEPFGDFVARYAGREADVRTWLRAFDADALRAWVRGFGIETFVGTSGRVFPLDLKAAPLLRAWVRRLRASGVRFHMHQRWLGWNAVGALRFDTPDGEHAVAADAVVLALGGGSWPVLGSDGAWVDILRERSVPVAALAPSNCGFDIAWSAHFAARHAGQPLKPVVAEWRDAHGKSHHRQGECVVTSNGIEGSLVYALSAALRETIRANGKAVLRLDLVPGRDAARLARDLAQPRNGRSLSEHLRRRVGIDGVKAGLVYELVPKAEQNDDLRLATWLKSMPLTLLSARPIDEAISSAGGVRFAALDEHSMIAALPGVFVAGEMVDWEAPTGGYLLNACLASGRAAGAGAARWLLQSSSATHLTTNDDVGA